MWREAAEPRNMAEAAMSSGPDATRSGLAAATLARIRPIDSSLRPRPNQGVSMKPGPRGSRAPGGAAPQAARDGGCVDARARRVARLEQGAGGADHLERADDVDLV